MSAQIDHDVQYVQNVLRTEAPITPEVIERFQELAMLEALTETMTELIEASENLDKFKKYLFYGKEVELPGRNVVYLHAAAYGRVTDEPTIRLIHSVMGMATEIAELLKPVVNYIRSGDEIDFSNMAEEGGDVYWYMGVLSDVIKKTLREMKDANNEKLRARFPDKFTEHAALNRNLDAERDALEMQGQSNPIKTKSGLSVDIHHIDHQYMYGYIQSIGPGLWNVDDGTCAVWSSKSENSITDNFDLEIGTKNGKESV